MGEDVRRESWMGSALVGGGVAAAVFLTVALGIGMVGDREAIGMLESTLPTIRFLCSSAIGAAATVLALMVTLVGLSKRFESLVHPAYFKRIERIGTLCVSVMVGGVGLLLLLTVPLSESEKFFEWYSAIYYAILVVASLLGGALVAMTMALRKAVMAILAAVHPEADSSMLVKDPEEETGSDPGGAGESSGDVAVEGGSRGATEDRPESKVAEIRG